METNDLQHIAPTLASLKGKGNGMKVPESYFEEFEIKNLVFSSPKQEFKVPDTYFETVEDNVFKALGLSDDNKEQAKVEPIQVKKTKQRYLWMSLAVAASLLLMVFINNPFESQPSIDVADVEMWLDEGGLDISSVELADLLADDFDNINIEDSLEDGAIEEYLLDEISSYELY